MNTMVLKKTFNCITHSWDVQTEPPIEGLPSIDYVYYAIGVQPNFTQLPFLQSMLNDHPIGGLGGLPCINEDLMWKEGVPLYVTGRLASLRLGPGAGNLSGARTGAERIAWSIRELLEGEEEDEVGLAALHARSDGNRYMSLPDECV